MAALFLLPVDFWLASFSLQSEHFDFVLGFIQQVSALVMMISLLISLYFTCRYISGYVASLQWFLCP